MGYLDGKRAKKCRYLSTKAGWFDGVAFNEWLESLMLPRLKKLSGKKEVIADNLSSHLNINIFKKCKDNDIHFICLPPNSTHLTQPLDVAFFHPMKVVWRKVLSEWKVIPEDMNFSVLPKYQFPSLLKKVLDDLQPNLKKNLESGLKKCEISPCYEEPLLARIAHKKVEPSAVSSAFIDALQSTREACSTKPELTERRKLMCLLGKASLIMNRLKCRKLNCLNVITEEHSKLKLQKQPVKDDQQPGPSKSNKPPKKKKMKKSSRLDSDEDYVDEAEAVMDDSSNDDEDWESYGRRKIEEFNKSQQNEDALSKHNKQLKPINKKVDSFVYPGVIEAFDEDDALVSAMIKIIKQFIYLITSKGTTILQ